MEVTNFGVLIPADSEYHGYQIVVITILPKIRWKGLLKDILTPLPPTPDLFSFFLVSPWYVVYVCFFEKKYRQTDISLKLDFHWLSSFRNSRILMFYSLLKSPRWVDSKTIHTFPSNERFKSYAIICTPNYQNYQFW